MHFEARSLILAGALLAATSCSMAETTATVAPTGKAPLPLQILGEANPDEGPAPLTTEIHCDILTPGAAEPQFEWDFGDGSKGKGKSVKHTFSKIGKYEVRVKASDKNGRIGDDTLEVEATKPETADE